MKILNRDVDYAVRALVLMARNDRPATPVAGMREEVRVSGPFLRKIMQKLQRSGFVHSVKGKGGGFALARDPGNIRLGELVSALQGGIRLNDCVSGGKLCAFHSACKLRGRLASMEGRLLEELAAITVKDLA
jgi:Rrf2 family nitric oxide-sensitive transcriptional repressor